jgi:redox-sensitive bicupin YhaK (pirin superfamily)
MDDAVEMVIEPRRRPVGDGFVRRLLPYRRRRMVGPFVFCDVMGPDELPPGSAMNVDAHPHIGLSTLTYLLSGRIVHRDSTGAVATIEPGAVNWMTAGEGVCHTERSHPDDVQQPADVFGVQTWVALPDDAEDGPPSFQHCAVADVPVDSRDGSSVRVAAGTAFGLASPVPGSSPLALAELTLDDSELAIGRDHPERAVLALHGRLRLAGTAIEPGTLAVLEPDATPSLAGTGVAVLLAGEPLGRRHIWWNFVHSDPDRIEAAKDDWIHQRFPLVPGDHDPYVPLPG